MPHGVVGPLIRWGLWSSRYASSISDAPVHAIQSTLKAVKGQR
jgi:hypothetical protein